MDHKMSHLSLKFLTQMFDLYNFLKRSEGGQRSTERSVFNFFLFKTNRILIFALKNWKHSENTEQDHKPTRMRSDFSNKYINHSKFNPRDTGPQLNPNNKERCVCVCVCVSPLITPDPLDRFWRNFLCVMCTHWLCQKREKRISISRKKKFRIFFFFSNFFVLGVASGASGRGLV